MLSITSHERYAMRYHLKPAKMAIINKSKKSISDEDVEKMEP